MSRKLALISGGSRGIGKAIVLELSARGYDIAFCYRSNEAEAAATRDAAEKLGASASMQQCDVSDQSAVNDWIRATERDHGPIEVVVNSAGITRDKPAIMMSQDEWSSVIDTNLTGTFNVCRAGAFAMMKRRRGSILNLSSVSGIHGNTGQSNYSASKAGIIGLSRTLAKELGSLGIRVNVVAPGLIDTDMASSLSEEQSKRIIGAAPIRRMGTATEVAKAVAFLCSEDASYITGQVMGVDGGLVL